jgi:hypothetical protein
MQTKSSRSKFKIYGSSYSNHIIFIAGLPKSGTTWLKKMLTSYPGFNEILIPDVAAYEFKTGGSHDYDLPTDIFSRFRNMLVVTKMHIHGSQHNIEVLRNSKVKYVIIYRDLRDVAVSYYFYVRQTPWHPEFPQYSSLNIYEGIKKFSQYLLPEYANWVRSWHQNRDPENSIIIRYEDLLDDTARVFTSVTSHFGLDSSCEVIQQIIDQTSFQNMSGGRKKGQAEQNNFVRKGIQGDWANYFTLEIKNIYKKKIGNFLIEFGYEENLSW